MPRETKRPPTDSNAELPDLTSKQHGFVVGILEGLTASDAYRRAYDAQNMADDDIWREASLLRSHPKVSQWLAQAKLQGLANTVVTLESHISELDSLKQEARQQGAYGAAIKAEELKGRATGLYVDQIKTDTGQADLLQALDIIGSTNPGLATSLREGLGLPKGDISEVDNQSTGTKH